MFPVVLMLVQWTTSVTPELPRRFMNQEISQTTWNNYNWITYLIAILIILMTLMILIILITISIRLIMVLMIVFGISVSNDLIII
jgi:hypothetical protein